ALQSIDLIRPAGSVYGQLSILRVARCKTSDPVGAGIIRSAAGSGSRGVTAIGEQQPVKTTASGSQVTLRSLTRQYGATVDCICTVFLRLNAALDGGGKGHDFG